MEANLSSVGGVHYAPVAEQLVMRDLMPALRAHDPELKVDLLRDQRELCAGADRPRAGPRSQCRQICFVDPVRTGWPR